VTIIFSCTDIPSNQWVQAINKELPDIQINVWPETGNPKGVEFLILWGKWPGKFKNFPNLKAILSLGAGVDHILTLPDLPVNLPIVRLTDPALRTGMIEYVLYNVIRFHRQFYEYEDQQRNKEWIELPQVNPNKRNVGILGLGSLGSGCAQHLVNLGFNVLGWSRSKKDIDQVACMSGRKGLHSFLSQSQIMVCLLPMTAETSGILNKENMQILPQGAFIINAARGAHLVEEDLLELINSNHIAGAALDVFETEPLHLSSPLWSNSKVTITPHVAAVANPESAAKAIAKTVRQITKGVKPSKLVDRKTGY
tara:strand:- start:294 stop:1223 length:930 start_codon:yes stop_codon:yes gene_type:complete